MKTVAYHNYTEKEALEHTSKIVDFGVALTVYSALNELLTAYALLKRSRYFRLTVKWWANEALRKRDMKVKELKEIVTHQGFSECYWDAVIDVCEDDVTNLRNEIKAILDDAHIKDSELYSQAEVARMLLKAAKIQFEEAIKECTNRFRTKNPKEMQHLDLFDVFREFYIAGISKEWEIVCDELYRNKDKAVSLTNERTKAAFKTMATKFANGLYINDCLKLAGKEYPEFSNAKVRITE